MKPDWDKLMGGELITEQSRRYSKRIAGLRIYFIVELIRGELINCCGSEGEQKLPLQKLSGRSMPE